MAGAGSREVATFGQVTVAGVGGAWIANVLHKAQGCVMCSLC